MYLIKHTNPFIYLFLMKGQHMGNLRLTEKFMFLALEF